jgi:hypothetical protein
VTGILLVLSNLPFSLFRDPSPSGALSPAEREIILSFRFDDYPTP